MIYKGRIIKVERQKKLLPGGIVADIDVVMHPGAVLVVPFLERNKVILLRQFRPIIGKYLYEFPAGTLEKKETPLECAKREIVEEAGYRAGRVERIGQIYPVPGYSTEKIFIFKAQDLKKAFAPQDKDEIIKPIIFTHSKIRALFKRGCIVDAKTIVALAICGLI